MSKRSFPLILVQLALGLGICMFSPTIVVAQQPDATTSDDEIAVRLVPVKKFYLRPGPIQVRIELQNVSEHDLFICRELDPFGNPLCHWELHVQADNGELLPGVGVAGDAWREVREPNFASALFKDWVPLRRGYTYSTTVDVGWYFPKKLKSGRYRLYAEFSSDGMLSESVDNKVRHFPDDIAKLPFHAWEGRVKVKPIWITIRTPAQGKAR